MLQAADKKVEAQALAKEAKELQADILGLRSGALTGAAVQAKAAAKRARGDREGSFLAARQALHAFYKSRVADLNVVIAKQRLPGIPLAKQRELSEQAQALKAEKKALETQAQALETYYKHPSAPPVSACGVQLMRASRLTCMAMLGLKPHAP